MMFVEAVFKSTWYHVDNATINVKPEVRGGGGGGVGQPTGI